MTFWTTQFHKSDADNDLSQTIDRINDAVVRLTVVLGNDDTQNTVLHDLKILKKTEHSLVSDGSARGELRGRTKENSVTFTSIRPL